MCRLFPLICLLPLTLGCDPNSAPTSQLATALGEVRPAPALEGNDADGNRVKLSDYRGKVVLVDFWATWCGPCRALIPHEKKLAKRMEGRPFVILGVSDDEKPETLKKFVKKEQIPWPNIFDGYGGPLARNWKVTGFPTMHLVDAKGIIRYYDIGGTDPAAAMPKVDAAIEKLVKEAEANP